MDTLFTSSPPQHEGLLEIAKKASEGRPDGYEFWQHLRFYQDVILEMAKRTTSIQEILPTSQEVEAPYNPPISKRGETPQIF